MIEKENPDQTIVTKPELFSKEKSLQIARLALKPTLQGALIMRDYSGIENLSYYDLALELDKTMKPLHDGDYSQVEALMFSQAMALDAIFGHLCRKALTGGFEGRFQPRHLELGLKAQRQSQNTLEALRGYRSVTTPAATVAVQINNTNGSPEQPNTTNEVFTMNNNDG